MPYNTPAQLEDYIKKLIKDKTLDYNQVTEKALDAMFNVLCQLGYETSVKLFKDIT